MLWNIHVLYSIIQTVGIRLNTFIQQAHNKLIITDRKKKIGNTNTFK